MKYYAVRSHFDAFFLCNTVILVNEMLITKKMFEGKVRNIYSI